MQTMSRALKVSYKPLWKLLIDLGVKKKDLAVRAGISPASITKMGKNGYVTTEVLMKICMALDCQIGDVMEFVPIDMPPQ
jgi:DNA-binding Xre family transcriptional regulator